MASGAARPPSNQNFGFIRDFRNKLSEFRAKCLKLMDEVADSDEEVVITKRDRPVSRLVPCRERPKSLFVIHWGKMEIRGDVIALIDAD